MLRRPVTLSIITVALMSGASCTSGQDSPPSPPALPSLRSSSADANNAAEQSALAAYRGMQQAYIAAGRTTDPQYGELARYADGDALSVLTAGLDSNKKQGLIIKGDVVLNPQVTELSPPSAPETAKIRDCLDTSGATRVKASSEGSPFVDTPGGRRVVTATAKRTGDVWKVISFVPMAVGTC